MDRRIAPLGVCRVRGAPAHPNHRPQRALVPAGEDAARRLTADERALEAGRAIRAPRLESAGPDAVHLFPHGECETETVSPLRAQPPAGEDHGGQDSLGVAGSPSADSVFRLVRFKEGRDGVEVRAKPHARVRGARPGDHVGATRSRLDELDPVTLGREIPRDPRRDVALFPADRGDVHEFAEVAEEIVHGRVRMAVARLRDRSPVGAFPRGGNLPGLRSAGAKRQSARRSTSAALAPPNPNEFDRIVRTSAGRARPGT